MKLPPHIRYLLFDMDGTLVDTEPLGPQTFTELLRQYGAVPEQADQEFFSKIWDFEAPEIDQDTWFRSIAAKYAVSCGPEDFVRNFYGQYLQAIVTAPALPGADDFLKRIGAAACKTALVTGSNKAQTQAILEHQNWPDVFDVIVTGEDCTKNKPDPEPYLLGIKRLGGTPDACVVFEDGNGGIKAASAAGCYTIAVRAGSTKLHGLHGADAIVNTFDEISL